MLLCETCERLLAARDMGSLIPEAELLCPEIAAATGGAKAER
jgi:hypothetical protein